MHLVAHPSKATASAASPHELFSGVPLSVVFADGDSIKAVLRGDAETIPLSPPFHVSDEDAYLVLPEDIGGEIVDILRDGDGDLLAEALRDGLLVIGSIEREGRAVELVIESFVVPQKALAEGLPYAETVTLTDLESALDELNALDHVQITVCSALVDEEGLSEMLSQADYVGASWQAPATLAKHGAAVEPTFVWSRRQRDGRVGIELALFSEYEELVVLLRPALLAPAG
jgi:hypothetical protein